MGKAVAAVDLEECNVSCRIDGDDVGSIALPVVGNEFTFSLPAVTWRLVTA
jgi:hypothetical protein